MENFVHASVSHAALAEFGRNARAVGVQLHALEIFEKNECMVRWAVAVSYTHLDVYKRQEQAHWYH